MCRVLLFELYVDQERAFARSYIFGTKGQKSYPKPVALEPWAIGKRETMGGIHSFSYTAAVRGRTSSQSTSTEYICTDYSTSYVLCMHL